MSEEVPGLPCRAWGAASPSALSMRPVAASHRGDSGMARARAALRTAGTAATETRSCQPYALRSHEAVAMDAMLAKTQQRPRADP